MDIICHTLSGVAIGTVAANFSKQSWKTKFWSVFLGGLGAALPDFDAISLWSKFDGTIGKLLGLQHTGSQIYFGKFWYSHHAAFHSLFAAIGLAVLATLVIWMIKRQNVLRFIHQNGLLYGSFILGFVVHLLEDMPTPAAVWGGVNFFFPSDAYIGGFGKIWWWNNYDIFLIILGVITLNLIVLGLPKKWYSVRSGISFSALVLGAGFSCYQMFTRPIDFSYSGHTEKYDYYEKQSKEIQRQILGGQVFNMMESLDNKIPLYF